MNIEIYENQTVMSDHTDDDKVWQIVQDFGKNFMDLPTSYREPLIYIVSTNNECFIKKSDKYGIEKENNELIIYLPPNEGEKLSDSYKDNKVFFIPEKSILFKVFYSLDYDLLDIIQNSITSIFTKLNNDKKINITDKEIFVDLKPCSYLNIIKNSTGIHIYGALVFSNKKSSFSREFGITSSEFINQFIDDFSLKFKNLYTNDNINVRRV